MTLLLNFNSFVRLFFAIIGKTGIFLIPLTTSSLVNVPEPNCLVVFTEIHCKSIKIYVFKKKLNDEINLFENLGISLKRNKLKLLYTPKNNKMLNETNLKTCFRQFTTYGKKNNIPSFCLENNLNWSALVKN